MTALELASDEGARQSNLAFTLVFLPSDRRRDALVFYNFCRAVDDIADDEGMPLSERASLLARWRQALEEQSGLPAALHDVIQRRGLDTRLLIEIILGMEMDLSISRYETFEDLRLYCWRVASAVGLVSIGIFGCRDPRSTQYAEHLGLALQLTNILRDVAEDLERDRIYLPQEDLRRFGVSEESLCEGAPGGDFPGLMHAMANRAKEEFAAAMRHWPRPDSRALASASLMQRFYQAILADMERDGFRVFAKRYRLSRSAKLGHALAVGISALRS